MNRRIRIVWSLSVVTVVLVLCVQAYWLYNQLQYNMERNVETLKTSVEKALDIDQEVRFRTAERLYPSITKLNGNTRIEIHSKVNYATRKPENAIVTVWYNDFGTMKKANFEGVNTVEAEQFQPRYYAMKGCRFNKNRLDSILNSLGCGHAEAFRLFRTNTHRAQPQYRMSGNILKTLHVKYSVNPIGHEAISFSLAVPVGKAIRSMGWQLLFSVLLFAVLCICMTYLIRTIVFQNRIDSLRREFIKNMMYEQKAAPEVEPAQKDAVRIGRTDFFYMANELRCGSDRVIITSRQAEILRLLAEKKNAVVSREELLEQVWGDDSFANSNALNVQITYLRRALKADETLSIEAVIRKGYSLREMKN